MADMETDLLQLLDGLRQQDQHGLDRAKDLLLSIRQHAGNISDQVRRACADFPSLRGIAEGSGVGDVTDEDVGEEFDAADTLSSK